MKPLRLILVFALLQGIVAFLTLGGSFTHEESMWHYIGHNWFKLGLTPYEGGVDNKSPLIFAVFGLSDLLFGLNFWFPRVLGIAVQSVGIYFLYKIAVHICSSRDEAYAKRAGLFIITIYGLSLLWHATGGKYVSFTETYAITLLIASVYFYLTATEKRAQYKWTFLSGLLAGFAFGWRISAGFGITAILLHALFTRKNMVVHFIAGFAAAIIALSALAIAAGISLQEIYSYAFAENFGSGSTTDHTFQWRLDNFLRSFLYSELLIFYPFIVGYFLLRKQLNLHAAVPGFLTLWLLLEFIGINVPGIYAWAHFKHLLPVMSLMAGMFVVHAIHAYKIRLQYALIGIWIIFFPKALEPLYAAKALFVKQADVSYCTPPYVHLNETTEKMLGQWIKKHTGKEDRVLVTGFGARVQLYSGRVSPSIYFNVTQTPRAIRQFKKELSASKPAMIAVPVFPAYQAHVQGDLRSFIDSLISREYKMVKQCIYGYAIYVNPSSAHINIQ